MQSRGKVLLVAFYNIKAQGVRYLETALNQSGYEVTTVFYKDFNSVRPKLTSEAEVNLLCDKIEETQPMLIGLSVMSSMYLDTVNAVLGGIKARFDTPVVCGGSFTSMFPEYFLERGAQFSIRTDGEFAITKLADCLTDGTDYSDIPSLGYLADGKPFVNPVGDTLNQLDGYGIPVVNSTGSCYIENDTLVEGDPQLNTFSYETVASRGCPFSCSYCCCSNLRKLLPSGTPSVRFRSVKMVIDEIVEAKKHCKRLVFIHFYDEVFPRNSEWIDEFVVEYKKRVNLPFTIWSHPNMIDEDILKKLVSVGLMEVIMGIQSGSPHIRREIFHRRETNEQIVEATRRIANAKVFWASYDFMLQHPFEKIEHLKETYYLAKQLEGQFELQLHGLNFLPGTDIAPMAVEAGYFTEGELDNIMFAPMEDQFKAYWKCENSLESRLWYELTYLVQYKSFKKLAEKYEKNPVKYAAEIDAAYEKAQKKVKPRYLYKKARIAIKSRLF